MPIKVTCQCGKSFAAKDELAGKAVKCPNCQQPLRIPGGAPSKAAQVRATAAAARAPKPAAKPTPKPAAGSSSSGIGLGDDLRPRELSDSALSEVGLHQQSLNTRPCPGCMAPLAPDAVICIKCGYNTKLGRRMETVKVGGAGGPEGHGAIAQGLLDRAAEAIEEQKEEDRKKTAEGVPVWVYGIGLLAVIGFCIMMSFIPQGVGMGIAGLVIIIGSFVINFYAWIRGLIAAFQENVFIGLGIFFGDIVLTIGMIVLVLLDVPFVGIPVRYLGAPILWSFFIIANWDEHGGYMMMMWFGNVLRWVGLVMLILGVMMAGGEQNQNSQLPPARPPVIAPEAKTANTAWVRQQPSLPRDVSYVPQLPVGRVLSWADAIVDRRSCCHRADEAGAEDRRRSAGWHAAA